MPALLPDNEAKRLAVLHDHQILDTPPDEEFDDLVQLAAHVCGVPIAAVSLIDEHRQWFKAITGLTVTETPRDAAFCGHTILDNGMMIVPDAQADPRFAENPLVTGDPHVRFYAGVPLITDDGYALGSLCVIDKTPRTLTSVQQATLRLLARQVTSQLRAARQAAERERLLAEKEQLVQEKEKLAIIALQEVTERQQAEKEVVRLAAIVESSEEAIVGVALDGTIVSWNHGAERLYGYYATEMIGQNTRILVGPDQNNVVPEVAIRLLRDETIEPMEVLRYRKDSTLFYALVSFSPIREVSGQTMGLSCIVRDITEQKRIEHALRESQARLTEAQQVAHIGSWEFDLATNSLIWSDELYHLFDKDPKEGRPSTEALLACYHPDDVVMQAAVSRQAIQDGLPYQFDFRILRKDGTIRWLHAVGRVEQDALGQVVRLYGTLMDITERRLSEERFRVLFEHSPHAHLLFDECGGIIDCNAATAAMMRCDDKSQLIGARTSLLSPEFQPDGARSDQKCAELCLLAHREGIQRFEWMRRAADGHEFPVEVTLTPVTLADRRVLLSVWHDLTERKKQDAVIRDHRVLLEHQMQQLAEANARLEALATTDSLTGLRNHRAFQERLTEEAISAARYNTPLSVVLLDVDDFKQFNDAYGHPAGDEVLRQVGTIIQSCARGTDLAARYGGEEFGLILPQTDGEGAAMIAERVREAIECAHWPKRKVTASLGVSSLSLGIEEGHDLITRADAALYQSKSSGRNRVTRYTHSLTILR